MSVLATVRASAFPRLFDCALSWYATHIIGVQRVTGYRAHLGTAIHAGAAAFDQARIDRAPITPDDACSVTVDTLQHPSEDVEAPDDISTRDAETIAVKLTTRYCSLVSLQHEFVEVESKCDALQINTDHGVIEVTGRLDRTRIMQTSQPVRRIADIKTGKTAVTEIKGSAIGQAKTKGHHLQLGIYRLLKQVQGEQMDQGAEIFGLQTTEKARVGVGYVPDVVTPLLGKDGQIGLIEMAAQMFKAGLFPPNPQSWLCSAKYCAYHSQCIYHD